MTDKSDNACKARGSTRERRCKPWNALGKDASLASVVSASPACQPCSNFDGRSLRRKIAECSPI
jgi:hypothetical protein